MKDLRSELRRGDPLGHDAGLSRAEVERMRRQLALATPQTVSSRNGPFLALAAIMLVVSVGSALVVRASLPQRTAKPSAGRGGVEVGASAVLRQLQFSTPGGTRVIWTFNVDFEMR
jgi:hypothetical protein